MIGPDGKLGNALRFAAALAVAALAVIVAGVAEPPPVLHDVQAGFFYLLLRFDQSLPLLGLGLALVPAGRVPLAAASILIAAGVPIGSIAGARLAAMIEADFAAIRYLLWIGPAYCVLMGIVLLAPPALRPWTLSVAGLLSGMVLGLGIGPGSLGAAGVDFAAGVLFCGIGLVFLPLLLLRGFDGAWRVIASRIFGSWLVAIGVMLAGLEIARTAGT